MAAFDPAMRPLLEALDEPALIIAGGMVVAANRPARQLFGARVENNDVRLAVRQPQVLELLLAGQPGDLDISGIGGFERPWTLAIRRLSAGALLARFIDRTAVVAAERMRVDFVANASHELRTPLSTILGYSETLADDAELERSLRTRFAGIMRSEAERMIAIIDDLMNLSRIAADRFVAPAEEVDLGALAREVAEQLSGRAGSARGAIELNIEPGLPLVRGDVPQLCQLIDNLLTNALRYGRQQESDEVRLSLAREDDLVRLTVADDGPGIATEHLPRLTERFYRVDAARSRASGGTGLGLAIVKHIVERHRGTLEIRSSVGVGTEVVVRIPALPPKQS